MSRPQRGQQSERLKPTRKRRSGCFNFLAVIFLLSTLLVIVLTGSLLTGLINPPAVLAHKSGIPAVLILPTSTVTRTWTPSPTPSNTNTPSQTWTPTITPLPPSVTPSITPIPTNTPIPPSATPSPPPTPTFTATATATIDETKVAYQQTLDAVDAANTQISVMVTNTAYAKTLAVLPSATQPTITPSPTKLGPTATATPVFSFQVAPPSPIFAAYDNCDFQGFSGQVLGLDNRKITVDYGLQIIITPKRKNGKLMTVAVDSDPSYGWLVKVSDKVDKQAYTVELRSPKGAALSEPVTVTFSASCDKNMALVNFMQVKPY